MTAFDENDVLEISSLEIEEYGNLIFDMKIKEFYFHCLDKNPEKQNIWIVYSYLKHVYFLYDRGDYFDKNFSSIISYERLSIPVEKKINNFRRCLDFLKACGGIEVVKLWCPSLVSTLKPAKV